MRVENDARDSAKRGKDAQPGSDRADWIGTSQRERTEKRDRLCILNPCFQSIVEKQVSFG